MGTAGALASIDRLDEPFLVMNGDILTTIDYSKLLQYRRDKKSALTVAITKKKIQIDLGVLRLDDNNNIIGYNEKPVKEFPASTGIYLHEPHVLKFVEPNTYLDFPILVLRLIGAGEQVLGYPTDAFWLDMGNRDDHQRAVKEFEEDRSKFHIDG